jgi:hypothetical protein
MPASCNQPCVPHKANLDGSVPQTHSVSTKISVFKRFAQLVIKRESYLNKGEECANVMQVVKVYDL